MFILFLILMLLTVPQVFLYRYLLRKYNIESYLKMVLLGFAFYFINALLVGAVFILPEVTGTIDDLLGWIVISIYGIILFSFFYVPFIFLLAWVFYKKTKRSIAD